MNYSKIYHDLINNRLTNPLSGVYTERHHIQPRSLGGGDEESNLVDLSAREHYICHLLLTRMYEVNSPEYLKMIKAHKIMAVSSGSNKQRDYKVNSRLYKSLICRTDDQIFDYIYSKTTTNDEGCIVWGGAVSTTGYGLFRRNRKMRLVNTYLYEVLNKTPIQTGYVLKLTCGNKLCCNFDHFKLMTRSEAIPRDEFGNVLNFRKSNSDNKHSVIFDGIAYESLSKLSREFGINVKTMPKYIDVDTRVFDIDAYVYNTRKKPNKNLLRFYK